MPSEKRARQRAARAQKQAVVQRRRQRRKNTRRGLTGFALVAVIVLIVLLIQSGGPPAKKSAGKKPTTTTSSTFPVPTTLALTSSPVAPTCPPKSGASKRVVLFTHAPGDCIGKTSVWDATFKTSVGTFVMQMDAAKSYAAVNNFVFLALYHYYDGTFFHRVIKGFMDQGGDPAGTGSGRYPGYSFTGNTPPKTCTKKANCYAVGDVALANSGAPSSDGGQFFILVPGGPTQLQPLYTDFGHVISGMSVVEKINGYGAPESAGEAGKPTVKIYVLNVSVKQVKA